MAQTDRTEIWLPENTGFELSLNLPAVATRSTEFREPALDRSP